MRKIITLFVLMVIFTPLKTNGQLSLKSYIPNQVVFNFGLDLSQSKTNVIDTNCGKGIFDSIMDVNTYGIVVYTCDLNLVMDSFSFNKDISNFVVPVSLGYSFYKAIPNGSDELICSIGSYSPFRENNYILCKRKEGDRWEKIKKALFERNWNYKNVYLYYIPLYDKKWTQNVQLIVEYKGSSYLWMKNDKLIPAMDYLKKNYTEEKFKELNNPKMR